MQADKINIVLMFSLLLLVVTFSGCTKKLNEPDVESNFVTGQINMESLNPLFSKYELNLNNKLDKVSIFSLDGTELATQREVSPNASFSFQVPSGVAYFIKAQTVDGVNLWAITSIISNDTVQDIDLNTTYEATLIAASLGEVPLTNLPVDDIKQKADLVLHWDFDRLVKTVKRVVNNAILKKVDYSPVTEVSKETLRAFGGGLEPVRSFDSMLYEPEPDYTPLIYAGRYYTKNEPNNILIAEIDAKRWDYRVQGTIGKYLPQRDYEENSIEDNPHVTNGGTTLVFTSTRHCLKEPYPCPCEFTSNESHSYTHVYEFPSIYTISLDAPADTPPTRLISDNNFDATSPMWSWNEEKIVFTGGQVPTIEQLDKNEIPGTQIYVMNKDGSGITQLTFDEGDVWNGQPAWSPDNKQIVYASDRTGNIELWIMNSDGSGNTQLTSSSDVFSLGPKFSPDGRQIVFESQKENYESCEIFVMDRDGSNVQQLTFNNIPDIDAAWAHNGIDIVCTSGDNSENRLVILSTLTGETLYDLGDFANAASYEDPVWAATNHILVPSKEAIEKGEYTEDGYVTNNESRTATANPPVQKSYETINKPKPKIYTSKSNAGDWRYNLHDQGSNWQSEYRYEIAAAYGGTIPYTSPMVW